MKFKEWFKNDKSKEEAPGLEKIARVRLFDKEEPQLELIDPEFQSWFLHKYPKTNDDSLANDAALNLLVNSKGYESFDGEENQNEKELDATSEAVLRDVGNRAAVAAERKHELLEANRQLFIIDRRITDAKQVRLAQSKSAFGAQDQEFYERDFSQSDSEVASLEEKKKDLEVSITDLEKQVTSAKYEYEAAMKRYYAFTGQLDPEDQENTEELN
jgi:phosphatidate phosphatase PAH1